MGRTNSYNPQFSSKAARARLEDRKDPYWVSLAPGFALGYARGKRGGSSWFAKYRDSESGDRFVEKLPGAPDDVVEADGETVWTYEQALRAAHAWRDRQVKKLRGDVVVSKDYSVADAINDYIDDRARSGAKAASLAKARSAVSARILPSLGHIPLTRLRRDQIKKWHSHLGGAPKLRRAPAEGVRKTADVNMADEQAVRARRATANRCLNILKAALNHALRENRISDDTAWKAVAPFKQADAPKVHFLDAGERTRLLNACDADFRDLVLSALVTGCRYGELTSMRCSQFVEAGKAINIEASKSGHPRTVALTDEGVELFKRLTAGKTRKDLIFVREDGEAWRASHQKRRIEAASDRAKVTPRATFHILRHTYASSLAMRGVPMGVIAAQLGHADTRMTERHYAHLAPSYVADTVRANLPNMAGEAIVKSNVRSLMR